MYPLSGKVDKLEPERPITMSINLAMEGVPQGAYGVIVYANIETGNNPGADQPGELIVMARKLRHAPVSCTAVIRIKTNLKKQNGNISL